MTRDEVIAYYKKLVIRIKGIVAEEGEVLKKDRFSQSLEATEMAVRSLEAWDKVLDELREYGSICVEYTAEDDKVDAVVDSVLKQAKQAVLEIINKHLNEIIISKHTEHICCYWNNGCTIGNHPCPDNYDCDDFD